MRQALTNPEALDKPEAALLAFVERVNAQSVDEAALAAFIDAGWSEEAAYDSISVCALFNFYNHWVDGAGVADMDEDGYRESGRRIARCGYAKG